MDSILAVMVRSGVLKKPSSTARITVIITSAMVVMMAFLAKMWEVRERDLERASQDLRTRVRSPWIFWVSDGATEAGIDATLGRVGFGVFVCDACHIYIIP